LENAGHAAPFEKWLAARQTAVERIVVRVGQTTEGDLTVSRIAVAANLLAELAKE
jgi:NAD-specific glutamate dehydrogenase